MGHLQIDSREHASEPLVVQSPSKTRHALLQLSNMGVCSLVVVSSPVQEALAHQLGGHVGDGALSGSLCGVMMHPAHAKVSNLHNIKQRITKYIMT